ncbi:MAG: amidohydrolase family protein [Verrucomicrobiota bacterium]
MRIITTWLICPLVLLVAPFASMAEKPWIIDPHTHFKGEAQIAHESKTNKRDPRNTLGMVVEPEDYRALADRLGIQSTLIVEAVAQDQPQFNDWVFAEAKSDLVCGYVARGDLKAKDFLTHHERYRKTGYLNGYRFRMNELAGYLNNETAQQHLKKLEKEDMAVDLLINHRQAADAIRLAREYPGLKIVLNHCLGARMADGKVPAVWKKAIADCGKEPNIFCKISSIVNFAGTKAFAEPAPADLGPYLPVLDPCFEAFGEDRVIFATNWGVCEHFGKVDDVVRIVREFLTTKGEAALKKGMRENAIRIYGISADKLR